MNVLTRFIFLLVAFFFVQLFGPRMAYAHTPGFVCNDPRAVAKLICADQDLSASDVQMTKAYFSIIADTAPEKLGALSDAHADWRAKRETCVNDNNLGDMRGVLDARQCMARLYAEYLAQLAAMRTGTPDQGGFLRPRPATLATANSYFTLLKDGIREPIEARKKLLRFRAAYPGLVFVLLAPSPRYSFWLIALATYVDSSNATKIKQLAEQSGFPEHELIVTSIPDAPDNYQGEQDITPFCFRSGATSARKMLGCSGTLVTPATLDSCLKGGACDSGLKPLSLEAASKEAGWSWDSPLAFSPPAGAYGDLLSCTQSDPELKRQCAASKVLPAPPAQISGCNGLRLDPESFGRCLISALPESLRGIAQCVLGAGNNPGGCLGIASPLAAQADTCIAQSTEDDISPETIACFIGLIPNNYAQFLSCLARPNFSVELSLQCAAILPELQHPTATLRCLYNARNDSNVPAAILRQCPTVIDPALASISSCVQSNPSNLPACIPAGTGPALNCLRTSYTSAEGLLTCLGAAVPDLQLITVIQCVSTAQAVWDAVIVCMPSDKISDPVRRTIGCVLKQTSKEGLASCAAAAVLNDDQQRIIACALGAQGSYFEFGICALGIHINKEGMIIAQCYQQTGGDPISFGVCAGGRLTMRELNKCLQGPIGSDTGCFGPNNVVVVTFKNAINDLTRGPGENNTVVVAYHAAEKIISDTGGQLGKGAESVCNGIAHTLFGGDKSC